MKSLRPKMLALVGSGMFLLAAAGCAPLQVITDLLGQVGSLFQTA